MQSDKLKHLAVGFTFGFVTLFMTFKYGLLPSFMAMTVISSFVFVGKEEYDCIKPNPTGFDTKDLAADYIGLAIGFIVTTIIYFIWKSF